MQFVVEGWNAISGVLLFRRMRLHLPSWLTRTNHVEEQNQRAMNEPFVKMRKSGRGLHQSQTLNPFMEWDVSGCTQGTDLCTSISLVADQLTED